MEERLPASEYLRKLRAAWKPDPQLEYCVYFVQADPCGLIKIGVTDRLDRRLAVLQNMSPVPLRLLGTMRGGVELERRIHRQFAAARCHGEWFRPTAALLALIASQKVWKPTAVSEQCVPQSSEAAFRDNLSL